MLDVGQANELKLAFRREGSWTNEEIKMLTERKGFLGQVREALLGRAEIKQMEHIVDLDSAPYIPDGWSVEEHQKGGVMKWDVTKVMLYLDDDQKNYGVIEGDKLRKKLTKILSYNANMLDFLLKAGNEHLIPKKWRGKLVFFWGTIYRDGLGTPCVRYLYWNDGMWCWHYRWPDEYAWGSNFPALVPAK